MRPDADRGGQVGTLTDDIGELMSVVAHTMGDVLLRAPLAPTEDFFDCGGDSMRAVEVLSRLIDRAERVRAMKRGLQRKPPPELTLLG